MHAKFYHPISCNYGRFLIHNRIKTKKTDSVLNQLIHFELNFSYLILYFRKRLTTVGWLIPNAFAISYVV